VGGQSLEVKKAKIEQEMIEKVLAWLQDGKDIRKGDWSPKEVRLPTFLTFSLPAFVMTKGLWPE
jgi:obg-like ATPase 1